MSTISPFTNNVRTAANQQERLQTRIDLSKIQHSFGWYIAGFVDGEGSFNISLRKKSDYRLIWQPVLSFNVSQKDKTMLENMKKIFHCGIIKQRKVDGVFSYDITNPLELYNRIIPFFKKFTFFSKSKRHNFALFCKATELMMKKRHLTQSGLYELVQLREQINPGIARKRKYSMKDVFGESSETTRQVLAKAGKDIVRPHGRP